MINAEQNLRLAIDRGIKDQNELFRSQYLFWRDNGGSFEDQVVKPLYGLLGKHKLDLDPSDQERFAVIAEFNNTKYQGNFDKFQHFIAGMYWRHIGPLPTYRLPGIAAEIKDTLGAAVRHVQDSLLGKPHDPNVIGYNIDDEQWTHAGAVFGNTVSELTPEQARRLGRLIERNVIRLMSFYHPAKTEINRGFWTTLMDFLNDDIEEERENIDKALADFERRIEELAGARAHTDNQRDDMATMPSLPTKRAKPNEPTSSSNRDDQKIIDEAKERARREQAEHWHREQDQAEKARRERNEKQRRERDEAEVARRTRDEAEAARREQNEKQRRERDEAQAAGRKRDEAEKARRERDEKQRREWDEAQAARRKRDEEQRRERDEAQAARRERDQIHRRERDEAEKAQRERDEKTQRDREAADRLADQVLGREKAEDARREADRIERELRDFERRENQKSEREARERFKREQQNR